MAIPSRAEALRALVRHALKAGCIGVLLTIPLAAVVLWSGLQGGKIGVQLANIGLVAITAAWVFAALRIGKSYRRKLTQFSYAHAWLHAAVFLSPIPLLRIAQLGIPAIFRSTIPKMEYWLMTFIPLLIAIASAALIAHFTKKEPQSPTENHED